MRECVGTRRPSPQSVILSDAPHRPFPIRDAWRGAKDLLRVSRGPPSGAVLLPRRLDPSLAARARRGAPSPWRRLTPDDKEPSPVTHFHCQTLRSPLQRCSVAGRAGGPHNEWWDHGQSGGVHHAGAEGLHRGAAALLRRHGAALGRGAREPLPEGSGLPPRPLAEPCRVSRPDRERERDGSPSRRERPHHVPVLRLRRRSADPPPPTLLRWADAKGEALPAYRRAKNARSIDGLPALEGEQSAAGNRAE